MLYICYFKSKNQNYFIMNKLYYFLLVIFMYSATACSSLYNYVQVFKIEAADKEFQKNALKQSENNLF